MSGHSKWAQIKHKKAISDAKKSQVFSKITRLISVAAREKGGDPEKNPKLRLAIEKARSINMPQENILRAIQRGTGELEDSVIKGAMYEGYGPGGVAVLIEVLTDNKNRTLSEIRNVFESHSGKLAESGSVKWLFKETARITVPQAQWTDAVAMRLIDRGVQDFRKEEDSWAIYAAPEELERLKSECEDLGVKIETAGLELVPSNTVPVEDCGTREILERLLEALDEHPDVQEIYSNAAF